MVVVVVVVYLAPVLPMKKLLYIRTYDLQYVT